MVFFVLLTLGFIFELGKNALTIDSRQTSSYNNNDATTPVAFISKNHFPKPHLFCSSPLQSGFLTMDKKVWIGLVSSLITAGLAVIFR